MKKAKITAGVTGGATASLLLAGTAHAATGDYVTDAVDSLSGGQSYIAPGADAAPLSTYDGTAVGIVALPEEAFETFTPAQLANQVYGKVSDKYETVIVVNANTNSQLVYGVAPNEVSEDVWGIIGGNNSSGEGRIEGLAQDKQELVSVVGTSKPAVEAEGGGVDAGPFLIGGGGLLAGVAIVAVITHNLKKSSKNRVKAVTSRAVESNELRTAMENFAELTRVHLNEKHSTASSMRSVLSHLNELLSRLETKGVGSAKRLAEVNYTDALKKLNDALGKDYYLDIMKKPELWEEPQKRTSEVEEAVRVVDKQLLENIRQVNSSKDLDFRVALDSLLRSVDQPSAGKMLGKG